MEFIRISVRWPRQVKIRDRSPRSLECSPQRPVKNPVIFGLDRVHTEKFINSRLFASEVGKRIGIVVVVFLRIAVSYPGAEKY